MSIKPEQTGFAAIFIDFENVYYFLKNQYGDVPDINDYIFAILRGLARHLDTARDLHPIIQKAYADFERIGTAPQGSLYLMGIDTHNVLGTDHKNAADMRLTIDAMEVLYTRPEISTFVFLAGDRDYIPVVQHLKRQAKSVLVAAFRASASGDLLLNVGEENFMEASKLIDEKLLRRLEVASRTRAEMEKSAAEHRQLVAAAQQVQKPVEVPKPQIPPQASPTRPLRVSPRVETDPFPKTFPVTDQLQKTCLQLLLSDFGQFHEIFLSPFLRKLSDALPRLADYERKNLLIELETAGALKVEKRKGEPYDYSVVLLNYNHPAVREVNPG